MKQIIAIKADVLKAVGSVIPSANIYTKSTIIPKTYPTAMVVSTGFNPDGTRTSQMKGTYRFNIYTIVDATDYDKTGDQWTAETPDPEDNLWDLILKIEEQLSDRAHNITSIDIYPGVASGGKETLIAKVGLEIKGKL